MIVETSLEFVGTDVRVHCLKWKVDSDVKAIDLLNAAVEKIREINPRDAESFLSCIKLSPTLSVSEPGCTMQDIIDMRYFGPNNSYYYAVIKIVDQNG